MDMKQLERQRMKSSFFILAKFTFLLDLLPCILAFLAHNNVFGIMVRHSAKDVNQLYQPSTMARSGEVGWDQ